MKPESVPSLNFDKLKQKETLSKFSPILKQSESDDDEICDCSECWQEEMMNEQKIEPIEFSDDSEVRSIKGDLLDERRDDYKNIRELKAMYEMLHSFN